MKWKRNNIALALGTLIMLLMIVLMGPMDIFTHGYFCEEIDYNQIAADDILESIPLENNYYEMSFSPQKQHFAGFEIYLANQTNNNRGHLVVEILDGNRDSMETLQVDLSKISAVTWYKTYISANLKKGNTYIVRFSAENYMTAPCLQKVDPAYLPAETLTGNVLLGYAYADSTFSFQEKILLAILIIAIWGGTSSFLLVGQYKKMTKCIAGGLFMVFVLAWNYMYNSIDHQNDNFSAFQADSETLVTGVMYAERAGIPFSDGEQSKYCLGRYSDLKGELRSYDRSYVTDDYWNSGYSKTEAAFAINANPNSRTIAQTGNYVVFGNGTRFQIIDIREDGTNLIIYLNSGEPLTPAKYGSLDDITFFDPDDRPLASACITAYNSQYGLQGRIFMHLARYMTEDQAIANLNLLCCISAAIVFAGIIVLIAKKYTHVFAGCFFVTFLLSPWIVNFARNLYWVEFTWFIPMAIGLFCAWKINSRECRIGSYIAAFIAIMGKCLCGYEYISTIMLVLIAFLISDLASAAVKKDREKSILLIRTIFIIGCTALAGFIAAICIHASLRGDGSILRGMKEIFEQDILRRTSGADFNVFDSRFWPSFNASVWEVFCQYFHFATQIITGLDGNLFALLCVIPLCIGVCDLKKRRPDTELFALYIVFFLAPVSWFILAKSHSYIHTGMNYVLWYLGYIQICFYIIIKKMQELYQRAINKTEGMNER